MMKKVLLALLLVGCEPTNGVSRQQQAVEAMGLTGYQETGPALFDCSESDSVLMSSTFTAVGRNGKSVSGAVCCGLILKDCTVRF